MVVSIPPEPYNVASVSPDRDPEPVRRFPPCWIRTRAAIRFEKFSFGSIRIDRITYEHDVVIDRGDIK